MINAYDLLKSVTFYKLYLILCTWLFPQIPFWYERGQSETKDTSER